MTAVVFAFGCPRSGTTFLYRALATMRAAIVAKIHEGSVLHPCQSDRGLVELSRLFRNQSVTLVRIRRHPLEIAESFVAARDDRTFGPEMEGIASHSDRAVVAFVQSESEAVDAQRDHFAASDHRLVEVRYEDLSEPSMREQLAGETTRTPADNRRVREALARFGTAPARAGRLSAGLGSVLSDAQRAAFRAELADVIEREGYR